MTKRIVWTLVILAFVVILIGAAHGAVIRTSTLQNPDGSQRTDFPLDNAPPSGASLAFDSVACGAALGIIANQSTGTATSINIDTACLTGTNKASSTLTIDSSASAANWSIAGSYPNRSLTHAGAIAGSGNIVLRATYMGNAVISSSYPWLYQTPPPTDTLAPPVPTRLFTTPGVGQIVVTGDVPWDACGTSVCKGTQDIQIQADGSGTVATVSVGAGFSCNPTTTNIGSVGGSPGATQSGNDWSITSGGSDTGSADQQIFVNCAFSGGGFIGAIVDSFSGDATDFRAACVGRRASQTATGSVEAKACIVQDPSTGFYYLDFIHRDTTDTARIHGPSIQVSAASCVMLEWTAANVHTVWSATSNAGRCNNDWTANFANYALGFPATSYVGMTATSNTGTSSATTVVFKQLDINSATWSYTHTTSTSHSYAARARDKQSTPNASAYSASVSGTPSSTAQTKWHPGIYGDCSQETVFGGDNAIAIGNAEYNAMLSCMDYWSTQTPTAKGVYIALSWASLEGDTLGCYSASCSNVLSGNVAGKIGIPLLQALLDYASNKGLKVLFGVDWFHHGGYGNCIFFPKYLQNTGSVCNGTDAGGVYGIVELSNAADGTDGLFAKMWQTATMDRFIAAVNMIGDNFDQHSALEGVLMMTEETAPPTFTKLVNAGYTLSGFNTQQARIQAAVKPHFSHTNIELALQWAASPSGAANMMLAGYNNASQAMGDYVNDFLPQFASDGMKVFFGTIGGHDFRGQLPFTTKVSDEMCGMAPAYGSPRYSFTDPQGFYDAMFTTGTADGSPPVKPNRVIYSRMAGNYCPTYGTQQWAGSTGWFNFWNGRAWPASTCPTAYSGNCNTAP